MANDFQTVEDVLADSSFMDWYRKDNTQSAQDFEQWLQNNPGHHPLINDAVAFLNSLPTREKRISVEETEKKLAELKYLMDKKETPVIPIKSSKNRWWLSAAAVLLIMVGAYAFWKLQNQSKSAINTQYGQIASNNLPDGSTMILNANSTAELSQGWEDGKDREVWLNGEAYFKVAKTPKKSRFIVHTSNLDVIVTGTQFNVQHRDNKTSVLLTEGSVIIRTNDGKELAMKPGDYVEMNNQLVERKESKPDEVLAWKENMISFDKTPMTEVAKIIKNHYGIKVTLADKQTESKSINGFISNDNLDVLLKSIEAMELNIQITRKENEIIFSSKD